MPSVINTVLEPIGVAPNRTVTVHTPGEPSGMPCSIGSTATPAAVSGTLRMTPGTVGAGRRTEVDRQPGDPGLGLVDFDAHRVRPDDRAEAPP